jgi:hypothetical protein
MKSIRCKKCGAVLTDNDPQYKGLRPKDAVIKLSSDHASKNGCDWPAANIGVVLKEMNR